MNNILFNQPTYATTGAATLVNAQNLSIKGAPIAGPNLTISSSSALTILGGAINGGGTVSNAYSLYINAPTGAGKNYAAVFNGGNIGIGSATPSSTFSLQGTSGTNPLYIASSTGTGLMVIQQNGNVGIGTSSPSQLLTVGNNNQFTHK